MVTLIGIEVVVVGRTVEGAGELERMTGGTVSEERVVKKAPSPLSVELFALSVETTL